MGMRSAVLSAVAVALLLTACGPDKAAAPLPRFTQEEVAQFTIKPREGWGPFTFTTSSAQIEQALGPAERKLQENALEYMSLGMAFTVNDRGRITQMLFGRVCAEAEDDALITACRYKTPEGIGMLSGREQIIAAYGEPSSARPQGEMEELQYRELGMILTLRNGKLFHINLIPR